MARIGNGVSALFDRVDDQHNFVVLDHVHNVWAAFGHLVHRGTRHACGLNSRSRALGGHQLKALGHQLAGHFDGTHLVVVFHRNEDLARRRTVGFGGARQLGACTQLALHKGFAKSLAHAHDFARGLHLWAKDRIDARELHEWEHRFFHAEIGGRDFFGDALRCQRLSCHATGRHFGQLNARGF